MDKGTEDKTKKKFFNQNVFLSLIKTVSSSKLLFVFIYTPSVDFRLYKTAVKASKQHNKTHFYSPEYIKEIDRTYCG